MARTVSDKKSINNKLSFVNNLLNKKIQIGYAAGKKVRLKAAQRAAGRAFYEGRSLCRGVRDLGFSPPSEKRGRFLMESLYQQVLKPAPLCGTMEAVSWRERTFYPDSPSKKQSSSTAPLPTRSGVGGVNKGKGQIERCHGRTAALDRTGISCFNEQKDSSWKTRSGKVFCVK